MERKFLQKQIRSVAKTYTEMEMGLPLSEQEEEHLLARIQKKLADGETGEVREIVHDVVYTFFTGQEED